MNILTACEPRQDILAGTFNPEIFTASLSQILQFYAGQGAGLHPMYTDAELFFRETTYPTDGLKMVLSEVFARLSGDNTVPSIHRLETSFGGGKTHALIACTHIGHKGTDLAPVTAELLPVQLLPRPGEVCVAGIAGDEIPVHRPQGVELVPYTLWGEIAFQIGGSTLYQSVETEAESHAAPGKTYFDKVLGGKKILLMLDELAQYAARLAAARADGSEQLAAFLMGLHGYARSNSGISLVLTLASATDAFANQTAHLAKLLSQVTGKEVSTDGALGIGQQAVDSITSVVSRDATAVVPVQAAEISRVLAKRLFVRIDRDVAGKIATAYTAMYRKSTSLLPDDATRADYQDRLGDHYPFHPTLIDFLNNKLASYENFQGTRGVLRVLALAVRNIWKSRVALPMIHACHLDLKDARTVNELIGRTGSGDLLPILNADIGGTDTHSLAGGRSNAELADRRNPHPEGWCLYEYTWKTVFLNSLVGRGQGLGSNIFGLTEQDALFAVAFPGLTPPQVLEALKEISQSAYYLRYNQGRYYASLDPSVNIALAKIRRALAMDDVDLLLDTTARKVVRADVKTFQVVTDVALPEHIPDNPGKPVLALTWPGAGEIDIEACITTAGHNRPRLDQNLVFILVPEAVKAVTAHKGQEALFDGSGASTQEARNQLRDLARTVLAMRQLGKNPQNHGINPSKLEDEDFKKRFSERENALATAVTESYKQLWYPSASGQIGCKEIRTAGGEGGASVLEQIRQTLLDDGELVTSEHGNLAALSSLKKLFFARADTIAVAKLRENFCRLRRWPILESATVLDQLIRAGVARGVWCLFRMGGEENTVPEEFYSRDGGELPLDLDFSREYALITPEGANQREWTQSAGPEPARIRDWIRTTAHEMHVCPVDAISDAVITKFGDVPAQALNDAVAKLVQEGRVMAFKGRADQEEKPDLISGAQAVFYNPEPDDVLITPATAAEKGWIRKKTRAVNMTGTQGAQSLVPLLRQIGSLYQRGAKCTIDDLDLTDLELPNGGRLRIGLTAAPPESVKDLGELFEVVAGLVKLGTTTEGYLEIRDPQEDCPFLKALPKQKPF